MKNKGQSVIGMIGLISGILSLIGVSTGATMYIGNIKGDTEKNASQITSLDARQTRFEGQVIAQYTWITSALYEIAKTQGAKVSMPPQLSTTTGVGLQTLLPND